MLTTSRHPSMTEIQDPTAIDLSPDEAIIESLKDHKIEELKLEPYSLMRQAIAADLCDIKSGILFNAIMTVWVCTLKPKEALEAHSDLEKAKLEAFEWAEKRGYSLWNWKPLIDVYNQINREYGSIAKARVQSDNGDVPDPNDGRQQES